LSGRSRAPFVAIEAAAMKKEDYHRVLLRAHRGSLLIEHVDQLDPQVQAALRQSMERGEVRVPGEDKMLHIDVRLLTSSTMDLRKKWDFDPILVRRLAVVELFVPPLSERIEDVRAIANRRLAALGLRAGNRFSACAASHRWTGNVDELERALFDPDHALHGALLDDAVAELEGDVSALAKKVSISTRALFARLAHHDVDIDGP
jgi:DNA-binding NtrC family response regulator